MTGERDHSTDDGVSLRAYAGLDDLSVLDDWSAEAEDFLRAQVASRSTAQLLAVTSSHDETAELLGIRPAK